MRRTAQATPGHVWSIATDIDSWPDTISGIDAVEVLAGSGFDVGTRWRETRTLLGKQATEEMWVTAVEEGSSYTVEAESRGVRYISVFTFRAAGDGATEIELSFTGQPTGAVAKALGAIAGPVASRSAAKALQGDLDDLAVAAERAD